MVQYGYHDDTDHDIQWFSCSKDTKEEPKSLSNVGAAARVDTYMNQHDFQVSPYHHPFSNRQ